MERQRYSSGTPGEEQARFSRAIRVGNIVCVSGTTAMDEHGAVLHPEDAGAQARFILSRIDAALRAVDASLDDVVRTRIFLRDRSDAEAVVQAHAEVMGDVRPANSFLHGEPMQDGMLLEIEADAVVDP